MLAKVSPASYRAMIEGQSFCGIFPLLLERSIFETFMDEFIGQPLQSSSLRIFRRDAWLHRYTVESCKL
jgi:hypothetical protein